MKIMLDLNVLLDYFQKRQPYYHYSSIVLSEALKRHAEGIVPAHALTTIHYIVSKHNNRLLADEVTDWLLTHFEVAATDKAALVSARKMSIADFEDAVIASLAEASHCNFIVTRNLSDFENCPIPALSPEDFVLRYVSLEESPPEDFQSST
jgi:predicted nucleic acid-binding protein